MLWALDGRLGVPRQVAPWISLHVSCAPSEDRRELRERGDSYDANDTWANLACSKHDWTLSVLRGQNTSGAVVNLRSNCSSWESLFQEWRLKKFALKLLLARHCKTEHVFARKAHRIAAMIRWGMSRQPCSFHTCCDRSNCLLWYRIFFCYRRSSRCVGHMSHILWTLCDWLRFIDWFRSIRASSPPVCCPVLSQVLWLWGHACTCRCSSKLDKASIVPVRSKGEWHCWQA